MPEMRFVIPWPDGRRESCYSPSLVINDFLCEGESCFVPDFLQRSRQALLIASERVQAKRPRLFARARPTGANRRDSHAIRRAGGRTRRLRALSRRERQDERGAQIRTSLRRAIVVGGGQAGLSASYWLSQAGVDHAVFEKKSIMHKWRDERWDSFCLVTPNWQCQLPGHPYDGPDPHGFMVKQEILAYLDGFVRKTNAEVREGVELLAVEPERDLFHVTTSKGRFMAEAVFLATSLYGDPYRPRCAERVPDSIAQVHSAEYRNATALPPGSVVVVGSGQSGAQIAEDLHLAGRNVHLLTGNAPRCARFYRGRDVVDWLRDVGQYAITVADEGMGRKRSETNHYLTGRDGGRDIDLRAFAREGMSLYGRLKDVANGRMMFEPNLEANLDGADRVYNGINALIDRYIADKGIEAPPGSVYQPVWRPHEEPEALDLATTDVGAIIWATGFTPDWSYVRLPIFDGSGYPVNRRGVTSVPGVYVLGLPWRWTWGSGRFLSVGRDAESVVQHWLQAAGMVSAA